MRRIGIRLSSRAQPWWTGSPFNPGIKRKTQIVLIAAVLKDSIVWRERRDIEALLNVLPINYFSSSPCHDHYGFSLPISNNRGKVRLDFMFREHRNLLIVAICQITLNDHLDHLYARWARWLCFHVTARIQRLREQKLLRPQLLNPVSQLSRFFKLKLLRRLAHFDFELGDELIQLLLIFEVREPIGFCAG